MPGTNCSVASTPRRVCQTRRATGVRALDDCADSRENASFFVSLLWMPGWTAVGSDAKLSQHGHTASFKEESLLTCLLSVILPQTGKVRAAVAGPAINTSNRTTFSLVIKGSKEGTMQGAGIMLGVTTAGKFNALFGGVSWGVRPRGGYFGVTDNAYEFTPSGRQASTTGILDQVLSNATAKVGARYRFAIDSSRLFVACETPSSDESSTSTRRFASDYIDLGVTLPPYVQPWALLGFQGDAVELDMSDAPRTEMATLSQVRSPFQYSAKVAPANEDEVAIG